MTLALSLVLLAFCLLFAALPLLRWLTPVEPSALKLMLFSALLSPALAAGLHGLFALGLGANGARWGTLVLLAALFFVPQARALRRAPLGRAAWLAVGCALLAAGWLAALLFGSAGAMRLGHDGLGWQVGLAQYLLAGGALEQPWLAGVPLQCSPLAAWLVSGLAALTGFGPAWIFAALASWSCALVLLCLHLWSAALWRSGRADVGVILLALFGWGAWSWWSPLPGIGGGWAVAMARVTHAEPGAVLHSGMAWIRGGPGVLALAYGFGGLYAGTHALRHGAAPWPLLAGICLALCLGVHPLLGVALVVVHLIVLWVAALSGGPRGAVLRRSLGEFGLPLIPAILLSLRFSVGTTPQRVLTPDVASAALAPGLGLLALALIGGYLALRGGGLGPGVNGDAPLSRVDRRTLVLQLVLMAACLSLVGYCVDGVHQDHALFFRAQGLGLAVLGAGIFTLRLDSLRRAPLLVLPLALALLLVTSGMRVAYWSQGVHQRLAGIAFGISDPRGHLRHQGKTPRSLALQQIRELELAPRTVLALRNEVPAERLPPEPGISMAGIPAGLSLLVDLDGVDLAKERSARLKEVLMGRMNSGANLSAFLMVPGRDVLLLVDEVDREASAPGFAPGVPRGVDRVLESSGLQRVVDLDGCALYLWREK
ncbi:MAG TPA: hypothetical protein EYQ25_12090 [Planctomycetes bacterium]|nr:hypothetical protein [Planctomycetota bacterium]HIL37022.1 hypothetical protein [Planctomycetota bacterium]